MDPYEFLDAPAPPPIVAVLQNQVEEQQRLIVTLRRDVAALDDILAKTMKELRALVAVLPVDSYHNYRETLAREWRYDPSKRHDPLSLPPKPITKFITS